MFNLSADDAETLTGALRAIPTKTLGELSQADLKLPPALEEVLSGSKWRAHLARGIGFVGIRGVPVHKWSLEESRRFFWVFGLKVGRPGLQDSAADSYLTDIRDTRSNNPQTDRQYKTRAAQRYHVDTADVVGLLCLSTAKKGGGLSRIISSATIFNELLKTPNGKKHAARLYDYVLLDTRGSGGIKYVSVAPLRFANGKLRTLYHTDYFRSAYANYGLGAIPEDLQEALNAYDEVANRLDLSFDMTLEPGMIQLVNNNWLLHSRTAYEDDEKSPRHLLRLWLTLDNDYSLKERVLKEVERVKVIAALLAAKLRG